MKTVVVASKNPVKINAAKESFELLFPDEEFEFKGVSVDSGVSDQPVGDDETFQGAFNRLAHAKDILSDADYWVSMEGGIIEHEDTLLATAWFVIEDRSGHIGKARAASFELPPAIVKLIREGVELGYATDQVFSREDTKHEEGSIGILTNNHITRTRYYVHPMICCLIPFVKQELYS